MAYMIREKYEKLFLCAQKLIGSQLNLQIEPKNRQSNEKN